MCLLYTITMIMIIIQKIFLMVLAVMLLLCVMVLLLAKTYVHIGLQGPTMKEKKQHDSNMNGGTPSN